MSRHGQLFNFLMASLDGFAPPERFYCRSQWCEPCDRDHRRR